MKATKRAEMDLLQPAAESKQAENASAQRAHTLITVTRIAAVEYLSIMPRQGQEALRRVTEAQARSLLALALVEPICRSRRGVIVALRIKPGVSVAAINAALRAGAGNRLPVAEDSRTVRPKSYSGHGITFEQIHVDEWDDGRPLDNRCIGQGQAERLNARVRSKIDRDGGK